MIYSLENSTPTIHPSAYVAPGVEIIGDVVLGEESSVWFGCVLRGDTDTLQIGHRSNIQDRCVLHTDPGIRLEIGDDVTVGHGVILHGCRIGSGSLIGIGSIILNSAEIGSCCLVGANTLVTENRVYPERSLILGSPGQVIRALTDEEVENIQASAHHYVQNAKRLRQELCEKR